MTGTPAGYDEKLRDIRGLIATDQSGPLVAALLEFAELLYNQWYPYWVNPVVHAVLDTGPKFQVHVARLLAERYEEAAADPVLRHRVTRVRNALRGTESTEGQPREARATLMRVLADREVHHDTGELVQLAESEFAEAVNSPETSSR